MKKMYLAIFLIILVAFVFAGCLSFSGTLTTGTTEPDDETSVIENYDTTAVVMPDPDVNETTVAVEVPVTSENENTTSSETSSETTTSSTQEPSNITVPASNEYNILKSGTFHMVGSMIDSTGVETPLEIAVTPDSIYMLSDFEGTSIGMLIKDEKLYMVYPDKRAYLELSDSIMNIAGFDIDELVNSENVNFSKFGDLTQADSVSEEVYEGHNCKIYHFKVENGETRVYMDGTKLVRLASYSSSGKLTSSSEIVSISGNVPAEKSGPPANYKAYKGMTGAISFIALLGDVVS